MSLAKEHAAPKDYLSHGCYVISLKSLNSNHQFYLEEPTVTQPNPD